MARDDISLNHLCSFTNHSFSGLPSLRFHVFLFYNSQIPPCLRVMKVFEAFLEMFNKVEWPNVREKTNQTKKTTNKKKSNNQPTNNSKPQVKPRQIWPKYRASCTSSLQDWFLLLQMCDASIFTFGIASVSLLHQAMKSVNSCVYFLWILLDFKQAQTELLFLRTYYLWI